MTEHETVTDVDLVARIYQYGTVTMLRGEWDKKTAGQFLDHLRTHFALTPEQWAEIVPALRA